MTVHPIEEGKQKTAVEKAFDNYNLVAVNRGLPVARFLTAARRNKIKMRLSDIGGLEGWNEALSNLEGSDFLCGDNDRRWRASIDFLLQESSLLKLLEGYYDHD